MTGQVFGYMKVIGYSHSQNSRAMWLCRCECGVEKPAAGKLLRNGKVTSCGCKKGKKKVYLDYKERRKELHDLDPNKRKNHMRKYREVHKEKMSESRRIFASLYRAKKVKRNAQPEWADKEAIRLVYKKARELGFTVDHIVPLQSKIVCGLHVWHNLQVIDAELNKIKSNRYWPDMPCPETSANLVALTTL